MKAKRLTIVAATMGLANLLQTVAWADFISWPVKWSQPVGSTSGIIIGSDRVSDGTIPWIMADDFLCNDPAPVKAVRWWGSYIGETTQRPGSTNFTVAFDISFYSSAGAHPNSKPGALLLPETVLAQEVFVGRDQSGDYVYRYDAYLPVPFPQLTNTEYFVSISQPSGENWGWHDAAGDHPALDWAAFNPYGSGWFTFQPKTDLAFEIMIPEPGAGVLGLLGGGLLLAMAWRRRK